EQVERAPHVDGVRALGLLDDLVDVGHRREVDDRLAAGDRGPHRTRVDQVADRGVDLVRLVPGRGGEVEDSRIVAGCGDLVDDVRADEPRPAGDEDLQPPTAWSAGRAAGR